MALISAHPCPSPRSTTSAFSHTWQAPVSHYAIRVKCCFSCNDAPHPTTSPESVQHAKQFLRDANVLLACSSLQKDSTLHSSVMTRPNTAARRHRFRYCGECSGLEAPNRVGPQRVPALYYQVVVKSTCYATYCTKPDCGITSAEDKWKMAAATNLEQQEVTSDTPPGWNIGM
ncbi:hypothetical protein B0O80DRAFT_502262 [Mortierella sp. GBAus27b]|nr:hypothetical protein B0O80DRAFT_502262 [Mortierella sp. GBAus27b]